MVHASVQSAASPEWARQLEILFERCVGAYSDLTLSGYRKDLEIFARWCRDQKVNFIPATSTDVASFIDSQLATCSYATIRRRATAIRFAHVLSDLPCPISHSSVHLALRRAARIKRRRPKQSLGLTEDLLLKMLRACPDTLSGRRDAALLSVGYDTLCRSCELSWMRIEDVNLDDARIYIPRAKSDPFGDGRFARLTERTQAHLSEWVEQSQIKRGPLFRGLHNSQLSDAHMATSSIRRIVKCAARRAGLETEAQHLSGHSMRVGAAQDMMKAGCDTIEIMTAGGWKNYEVVARYVEHTSLERV